MVAARARFGRWSAPGAGVAANVTDPPTEPLRPLDEYAQKVQRSQARGLVYPYELIPVLTGSDGKKTDLTSGMTDSIKKQACDFVLKQGQSML